MTCRIINKTKNSVIVEQAQFATTFFRRLIGLMFRKEMNDEEALIFYRAPSIHTYFMRFNIDLVFLDENMRVIKVYQICKPFKVASCLSSFLTIEFAAYKTLRTSIEVGDEIEITLMPSSK